jgi:flagellar hook-associated protein 2
MAAITSTGLGTGLDINSIVTGLVAAEKDPQIAQITKDAEQATAQISALGQVNSLLSSLKSSYSSLNKNSTYNSASASSSDSSIVTATTGFGATPGTYDLEVQALAQPHTLITKATNLYTSVNDVVGGGSIQIRFGSYSGASFTPDANSTNQNITIAANATLTDIRDTINNGSYGITAGILYDGTGYRLTLQNDKSGVNAAMEITTTDDDGNNTDATGLSVLAYDGTTNNLDQTLAAQDAKVVFNGIVVTRDNNSVDKLIDGVTFDLKSAKIGTNVKVTVSPDTTTIESEIRAFVDNYNNVATKIAEFTAFNSPTDKGVLIGDASVRSIESFMRSILNTRLTDISGSIKSMADLGITTNRDGTLDINEDSSTGLAVFSDVLANNIADVASFFAKSGNPSNSSVDYVSSSSLTKEGTYNVNITQIATQASLTGAATLPADFSATPFIINESNNAFVVRIDGILSNEIKLTNGSYTSESALIAEMQSQINSDATLKDKGVAVNIGINNQQLTINSNQYGSNSLVAVLSLDDSVTGAANLDFSTPPLVIGATSTFDVTVDGSLGSIDLTGSYNAESDLITALQAAILTQTGKNATVSIANNQLSIKSDSGGNVAISNLGATTLAELGLSDTSNASNLGLTVASGTTGVNAEGTINGAAALGDGQFLLAQSASGDANGIKLDVKGGTFNYLATTAVKAYGFTAAASSTFQLSVDGTLSTTLDLSGQVFNSDSDVTTAIQTLLDADANLLAAGESVTVSMTSGKLQFTSTSATSQLSVTAAGAGAVSDFGLSIASATIDSTISFSEGITTKMDTFLNAIIDNAITNVQGDIDTSDGIIDGKTDSLYKKLQEIDRREADINFRSDAYEKRLFKQFNAMDLIVSQLNGTSQALQGALDALPGSTREKK